MGDVIALLIPIFALFRWDWISYEDSGGSVIRWKRLSFNDSA